MYTLYTLYTIHHTHKYTYLSFNWNIHLYHLIETVFDGKIHGMGEERKKSIRFKYASKYCVEFWEVQKLPFKASNSLFINSATYINNNCMLTNFQKTKERYKEYSLRYKAN